MQYVQGYGCCEVRKEKRIRHKALCDISNTELSKCIDEWVKDKRARDMLKDRFIDGLTFGELSAKYHICERHVKRIVYKHGDFVLSKI